MKLLSPAPGFVVDRLTILDLKIAAAEKKQMNRVIFQVEKASLEEYLRGWEASLLEEHMHMDRWEDVQVELSQKKVGLIAVNSLLWEAYDRIRELSDLELSKLAMQAKHIAKLGDARAKLISELNELYGAGKIAEKIFGFSLERSSEQKQESQMKLSFAQGA